MPAKKQWYAIKHKKEKQWTAYELTRNQVKQLKPGYKCKGPFKSFINCLIA